jgi:hypothetical protein
MSFKPIHRNGLQAVTTLDDEKLGPSFNHFIGPLIRGA